MLIRTPVQRHRSLHTLHAIELLAHPVLQHMPPVLAQHMMQMMRCFPQQPIRYRMSQTLPPAVPTPVLMPVSLSTLPVPQSMSLPLPLPLPYPLSHPMPQAHQIAHPMPQPLQPTPVLVRPPLLHDVFGRGSSLPALQGLKFYL